MEKRRSLARRIGKWLLVIVAVLLVGAAGAHVAWKYSGDDQPRLVIDKKGIKVYTIKTPGQTLLKVKAERVVQTSLDRAAAAHLDGSLENCHDWIPDCFESVAVKHWDPAARNYVQLWKETFPEPFAPREFLLHTQFTQSAPGKPIIVTFTAAPDAAPQDNCCYRLTHMNAVWTLEPISDNEVRITLQQDIDVGLPYFLFNDEAPHAAYGAFKDLPRLYAKAKYDSVTLQSIYDGHPIVAE